MESRLRLNFYSWWVVEKKTKLMIYSALVEIEVEVGVELQNRSYQKFYLEDDTV